MTLSKDHDSNGKFAKGNKAASGTKEMREMKSAIKDEIIKCAYSLLSPFDTLNEETHDIEISRYQYLVNKAVTGGDIKLITWLTEMAIGRPKHDEKDHSGSETILVPLPKEYQESLLDMALEARKKKMKDEEKK